MHFLKPSKKDSCKVNLMLIFFFTEVSSIHTISDSGSFQNASSPPHDSFEQGPYPGAALSLDDNVCL